MSVSSAMTSATASAQTRPMASSRLRTAGSLVRSDSKISRKAAPSRETKSK